MKEKHGKRGAILMQSVDCDCCIKKKTKKKKESDRVQGDGKSGKNGNEDVRKNKRET